MDSEKKLSNEGILVNEDFFSRRQHIYVRVYYSKLKT